MFILVTPVYGAAACRGHLFKCRESTSVRLMLEQGRAYVNTTLTSHRVGSYLL
jgi:hypothetical protein